MAGVDGGGTDRTQIERQPREIRLQLSGTHSPDLDLAALEKWLQREAWYQELIDDHRLTVVRRPAERGPEEDGARQGPPMGMGIDDLVLVLAGAALQPVFDQAYGALRNWITNRRRHSREGEDPTGAALAGDRRRVADGSDPEAGQREPGE